MNQFNVGEQYQAYLKRVALKEDQMGPVQPTGCECCSVRHSDQHRLYYRPEDVQVTDTRQVVWVDPFFPKKPTQLTAEVNQQTPNHAK